MPTELPDYLIHQVAMKPKSLLWLSSRAITPPLRKRFILLISSGREFQGCFCYSLTPSSCIFLIFYMAKSAKLRIIAFQQRVNSASHPTTWAFLPLFLPQPDQTWIPTTYYSGRNDIHLWSRRSLLMQFCIWFAKTMYAFGIIMPWGRIALKAASACVNWDSH